MLKLDAECLVDELIVMSGLRVSLSPCLSSPNSSHWPWFASTYLQIVSACLPVCLSCVGGLGRVFSGSQTPFERPSSSVGSPIV